MASLLRARDGHNTIHNTDIFINDCKIAENGYPDRNAFLENEHAYLSVEDFIKYREKVLKEKQRLVPLRILSTFIVKWVNDNRKNKLDEIKKIIESQEGFPVNLSIMYDDRLLKHTSHLILSFKTDSECTLHIENTIPVLEMLKHFTKEDKYITDNKEKLYEHVRDEESSFLDLYLDEGNKKRLVKSIELTVSVNKIVVRHAYARMVKVLQGLGIPITEVKVHHSHNQKQTRECVVFAIQNKLDTVTRIEPEMSEKPRLRGIRLRAEQVILSYLLTGKTYVPRHSGQDASDCDLKYDEATWYPGFTEVCKKVDEAIKSLSFQDLNRLYSSIELGETIINSTQFSNFIFSAMKEKMPHNEYQQVGNIKLNENRARFLEKATAPGDSPC